MKKDLEHTIKTAQGQRLKELLGRKLRKTSSRKKVTKITKRKEQKNEPTLARYLGKIGKRFRLRGTYQGVIYKAVVNKSGTVRFNGTAYNSPSTAGKAAIRCATNGWVFWKYRNEKGVWVKLDELRK